MVDYIYGLQPVKSLSDALRLNDRIFVKPLRWWVDQDLWAKEKQSFSGLLSMIKPILVHDIHDLPSSLRVHYAHQKVLVEVQPEDMSEFTVVDCQLIMALDGITDPQNLGAILRTAKAMAVDAVVMPKHNQVSVNATVRRIAMGAAERLPIIKVNNLANWLKQQQSDGFWLYGASAHAATSVVQQSFDQKAIIILGSEGKGMRQRIMNQADFMVSIPTAPSFSSLNVVQAAAMLLYAYRQQHNIEGV